MKQDYVLKKYVRAESAGEAILLDDSSKVDECFLVAEKPARNIADAIGFHRVSGEDGWDVE